MAAEIAEAAAGVGAFNSPIVTTLHTRAPHMPSRVPLTPFPGFLEVTQPLALGLPLDLECHAFP